MSSFSIEPVQIMEFNHSDMDYVVFETGYTSRLFNSPMIENLKNSHTINQDFDFIGVITDRLWRVDEPHYFPEDSKNLLENIKKNISNRGSIV